MLVGVSKAQYTITIKGSGHHNILLNSHWQNSITTVVDMFTYVSAHILCSAKLLLIHTYDAAEKL